MDQPKEPWFQLTPDRAGEPDHVRSPTHTRVQRQFLSHIWSYQTSGQIDEFEQELNSGLVEQKRQSDYGVTIGGDHGFSFRGDGKAVLWFTYDDEAEEGARTQEMVWLEMPMAEAEPLFRAWIASRRHFNALAEKHGTPLPLDKRPTVYPPPATN